MTVAHTSAFYPVSLEALRAAIQDQGLTEDLGVRPAPLAGQVSLYALEGASSWPYESIREDCAVPFEIDEFLYAVAQASQEIEVHENGECEIVAIGSACCRAGLSSSGT